MPDDYTRPQNNSMFKPNLFDVFFDLAFHPKIRRPRLWVGGTRGNENIGFSSSFVRRFGQFDIFVMVDLVLFVKPSCSAAGGGESRKEDRRRGRQGFDVGSPGRQVFIDEFGGGDGGIGSWRRRSSREDLDT